MQDSINEDDLKNWKDYAQREFDEMGRINRLRLKSMFELVDKEKLQAIFEIMLMFDINPLNSGPLRVKVKSDKVDKEGNPAIDTLTYDFFNKGSIYGIDIGCRRRYFFAGAWNLYGLSSNCQFCGQYYIFYFWAIA